MLPAMLLLTASACATTLARMDLDQLAAAAHAVVRVECLDSESRVERGQMWTVTRFELRESFKGYAPGILTVRLPGGSAGGLRVTIDGVPRFAPGEETILFLERTQRGEFTVTGWVQGTFRVRRDTAGGGTVVTQDSAGFAIFDPESRRFMAMGARRMPLDVFRARLAAAVERAARGARL